jgi:hypothetical protein
MINEINKAKNPIKIPAFALNFDEIKALPKEFPIGIMQYLKSPRVEKNKIINSPYFIS